MEKPDLYLFREPEYLDEARIAISILSAALLQTRRERDEARRRDAFMPAMFNKVTIKEFMRERVEQGRAFGVFLIDLNRFKEVNDTLGHSVGDEVLLRFGELIGEAFKRATDTVSLGRVGGDEFVVIVDMEIGGRRDEDLVIQMDNIYYHLRDVEAQFLSEDPRLEQIGVGFSIGCSLFNPRFPTTSGILYDQADEAMYEEKQEGGSRRMVGWM
jgi:diguanylate cyclase (GGDEF)-like protein